MPDDDAGEAGRAAESPITWQAALITFALGTALTAGGNLLTLAGHMGSADALVTATGSRLLLGELAGAIWVVGAVSAMRWWPAVGGVRPRRAHLLVVPAVVLGVFAVLTAAGGGFARGYAPMLLLNTFLIGVSEELFFRGVFLGAALRRFSPVRAVVLVAVVFGLVHVSNVLFTGNLGLAAAQAGAAVVYGLWSTALRYETRSIIPLIAIHWAWDALLLFAVPAVGVAAVFAIPSLLVFGLWLLADIRRREPQDSAPPKAPDPQHD